MFETLCKDWPCPEEHTWLTSIWQCCCCFCWEQGEGCCEISWAPPLPNRWETGQIMALGEETIMLWLCESSICKEAILLLFFLDFSKINSCLHQHEIWLKSSGFLWPLTFCPVAAKGTNQRTPGRGVLVSLGRLRQKTEKRPISPWHRKTNRRKCRKH